MASSSSWMPKEGKYPVNIGTSLGRAIKQRKSKGSPAATTKKSNLPEREFYSFKFGFKASSIDTTKPATIEIKKGVEANQVTAEYPSTQAGEVHIFTGQEQRTKEVECVLVFDEETGVFTLEKIDTSVHFKFDRKQTVSHENSPAAVTPASSSSGKGKAKQEEYEEGEEAGGDIDDFEDIFPTKAPLKQEEEEEGEEIEVPLRQVVAPKAPPSKVVSRPVKPTPKARSETKAEIQVEPTLPPAVKSKVPLPQPPPQALPQPQPHLQPQASQSKSQSQPQARPPPPPPLHSQVKPSPPSSLPPKPKPAPVAAPTPAASRNIKRKSAPGSTPIAPTSKDEVIEFEKTAKRPRPSVSSKPTPAPAPVPPPAPPSPLALPGSSSTFSLPPAPATARVSTSRAPPPSAPSPQQVDSEDDDEDWEAVVDVNPRVPQQQSKTDEDFLERAFEEEMEEEIFGDGFATNDDGDADMEMVEVDPADDGEDINEDLFEAELNAELQQDSEDDFLAGAISPLPGPSDKKPLSMESLAAGVNGGNIFTDDEYSSSDDSDED